MSERLSDVFVLVAGPDDGRTVGVEQCEHANWPDLNLQGDTSGSCYRYDEERGTYVWQPR